MKIDDCMTCKNHISYQNGYVICNFWKMQEQRVTGSREGGPTYIVACPREENRRA
ncbi:MAG TPA: hypothetical protein PLM53_06500 [Spirochaetota bacterium]|nr:hypothetical protein [Spirochaetota bacterium]HPC39744.1 hypothetical protein [Spirochaetota bacterium]HPL18227.1 hypothetical protein [Spirochaetota bacterium]HQF07472.1 hypothetical protein [Spirochaetota bacterium]HQH96732.1 hypothetical protein [Spirochaetota bacterium]